MVALQAEAPDHGRPAGRVVGQHLGDESCFALEIGAHVALKPGTERPFGTPYQHQQGEYHDGEGAEHQPAGEVHFVRTPRSADLKR
jgi:hypothetical protein